MTEHQFTPGEHTMRNGNPAVVKFRMPEPRGGTNYPLIGCKWTGTHWAEESWTLDGKQETNARSGTEFDLMPPRQEYWVVKYHDTGFSWWKTREGAEASRKQCSPPSQLVHVVELRPGETIVSGEVSDE